MGFLHASYGTSYSKILQLQHTNKFIGIGALTAPLSATRFAQLTNWSTHYLVSLFLSLLNVIILARVFRFQAQDGMFYQLVSKEFLKKDLMLTWACVNPNRVSTASRRNSCQNARNLREQIPSACKK